MEVKTTKHFERLYRKLPVQVKKRAVVTGELLGVNPFDSRLRTHKLTGTMSNYYAASIDYRYRIVFTISHDVIYLHAIGGHDIYF